MDGLVKCWFKTYCTCHPLSWCKDYCIDSLCCCGCLGQDNSICCSPGNVYNDGWNDGSCNGCSLPSIGVVSDSGPSEWQRKWMVFTTGIQVTTGALIRIAVVEFPIQQEIRRLMKAVKEKGKSGTDWGGFPANLAANGHIHGGWPSSHFCWLVYVEICPIKEMATF